jgi:hypothetical protein
VETVAKEPATICWTGDTAVVIEDGAKLKETPDGTGDELEQFILQQSRAMLASVERSVLFALSQHSIILPFVECRGAPDAALHVIDTSKNRNVSRLSIRLNIGRM